MLKTASATSKSNNIVPCQVRPEPVVHDTDRVGVKVLVLEELPHGQAEWRFIFEVWRNNSVVKHVKPKRKHALYGVTTRHVVRMWLTVGVTRWLR